MWDPIRCRCLHMAQISESVFQVWWLSHHCGGGLKFQQDMQLWQAIDPVALAAPEVTSAWWDSSSEARTAKNLFRKEKVRPKFQSFTGFPLVPDAFSTEVSQRLG